jgi:predicted nucleic acid-binding protein
VKLRAYLDTNVFVYGLLEECNSSIILSTAEAGDLEVVVSELVVEEVQTVFKRLSGRAAGFYAMKYVETLAAKIVKKEEMKSEIMDNRGKIKDKDVENVAAVRYENLEFLVAYDRDYEGVPEYITPKDFIERLGIGIREYDMEY